MKKKTAKHLLHILSPTFKSNSLKEKKTHHILINTDYYDFIVLLLLPYHYLSVVKKILR